MTQAQRVSSRRESVSVIIFGCRKASASAVSLKTQHMRVTRYRVKIVPYYGWIAQHFLTTWLTTCSSCTQVENIPSILGPILCFWKGLPWPNPPSLGLFLAESMLNVLFGAVFFLNMSVKISGLIDSN